MSLSSPPESPESFEPFISVILPVFNGAHFLADAVASIRAQKHRSLEILIVDDGSTDGVEAQLGQLQVDMGESLVVLRQPNRGPAAARNVGLRAARGEIIAFLDVDDRWPLGKLRLQLQHLHNYPELDIVLGHVHYVLLEGATDFDQKFVDEMGDISHVHLGAGLFEEHMRQGEDLDWFMRVRESKINMTIFPEITLLYQKHAGNLTRNTRQAQAGMFATLRQSLERRRTSAGGARDLEPWTAYKRGPIE
jgi:glycosyltransferase involved in cell wall biosynthesis